MSHQQLFELFRRYRGSGKWAATRLNVRKQTVSAWLMGKKTSARMDEEMPKLAAELLRTNGRCIGANGPSVRVRVKMIRRKRRSL